MKANFGKCHLLLSTPHERNIRVSGTTIKSSKSKKLLSVHFDNKPKFDTHIEIIRKKANRKLNALARITPFMDLYKRKIIINSFFNYQQATGTLFTTCLQ